MDTLLDIHRRLVDKIISSYPQYRDKRIRSRQVKKTVVPDIYKMGLSLVNKIPIRDLDKLFIDNNVPLTESDHTDGRSAEPTVESLTDIIKIVADLQLAVSTLERDNKKLYDKIKFLPQCTCQGQQSKPEVAQDTEPEVIADVRPSVITVASDDFSSASSGCTTSDDDEDGLGFQPPPQYMKKIRRLERKVKTLTTDSNVPVY